MIDRLIPAPKEVHYQDGRVWVDGKWKAADEMQTYREGQSTRTRSRTRGGAGVRAKDSLLHWFAQFIYTHMCKYTSVLSMLGACFARLAQQNHVYGKVSVEYLHV